MSIRVCCVTSLDLPAGETWPTSMPAVPRVGDYIQSNMKWGVFQLELEVVAVTWKNRRYTEWFPEIELHDKRFLKRTIREFFEWYAPLVGRSPGNFI